MHGASKKSLFLIVANLLVITFLTISFARSYASTDVPAEPTVLSATTSNVDFNYTDSELTTIAKLANQKRVDNGAKALVQSAELDKIAASRAADMQTSGYYAHLSPSGIYFYNIMDSHDLNYDYACENLNISEVVNAEYFIKSWIESTAGHRECLLNFSHTKVGYALGHISSRGGIAVDQSVIVAIYSN